MSGTEYDLTANFKLKKPWIDADDDIWGIHINQNMDLLDNLLETRGFAQGYLPLGGGVMGGPIVLSGDATQPLHAVPLQQLNAATAGAPFLPLAGVTPMAGPLNYTATGSTALRAAQDRAADVANVLEYGAGLGGDDAVAIRAAIASGKKVIYVPPGTYTMKSTVPAWGHAADPVCIQVLNASDLTIIAYGATFLVDNSISSPVPTSTFAFENNCKHCSLLGGTIVGNNSGLTPTQENVAISFTSVTGLTVRDVKITGNFLTAIAGVYAFDSLFDNVSCFNNRNPIDIAHVENLAFSRCRFFGATAAVTGINLHYDTPTLGDNTVTTEAGAARSLLGGVANKLRVTDCLFDGFGNGIAIDAIQGALVSRTTIRNGLAASSIYIQSGIQLYQGAAAVTAGLPTTDVTIDGCDIYGNGVTAGGGAGAGVFLSGSSGTISNVSLVNCRIYDNTNAGVSATAPANVIGLVVNACDFRSRSGGGLQPVELAGGLKPILYTSSTSFTVSNLLAMPNNTGIYMQDSGGVGRPILSLNPANVTFLRPGSAAANVQLESFTGAAMLTADSGGNQIIVAVPLAVTGPATVQPPTLSTNHFDAAQFITSTAKGSGTNGPATAQMGLNINHQKTNYLTTTNVGEIDGIYVTVRQGGPGSDVGGLLVDVGNTGNGFTAILEGVSTQMAPTTGASVRAVRAQLGTLNPQTPLYNGLLLQAQLGTSSPALLINDIPGQGQWTNFIEGWLSGSQNFVVTNAGAVSAAGGFYSGAGQVQVTGHTPATTAGAYFCWNRTSGQGIAQLLCNKGGGSAGGFMLSSVNASDVETDLFYVGPGGIYFQPSVPVNFATASPIHMPSDLVNAANDAAAGAAGVPVGVMYRNGSVLQVRVT